MLLKQWVGMAIALGVGLHLGQPLSSWAVDDSDISGGMEFSGTEEVSSELSPDEIKSEPASGTFSFEVLREDHGQLTAVPQIFFQIRTSSKTERIWSDEKGQVSFKNDFPGTVHIEALLKNEFFDISHESDLFKVVADLPGQGKHQLIFRSETSGGQVLGIWQLAQRAKGKLEAEVGLSFWNRTLNFVWPAEGDYYSFGQVHLTRGDHWDVVGHEMGHGIYDLGGLGAFGGGAHKIDQCYSQELALSEGWASFFSAWVSLGLNDSDAKFEFMVPRRAPIQIENIPADVCRGETNEWRVTGFFWDLLDLHDDGESVQDAFSKIWRSMKGSRVTSTTAARNRLKAEGFDPSMLEIAWQLNFLK